MGIALRREECFIQNFENLKNIYPRTDGQFWAGISCSYWYGGHGYSTPHRELTQRSSLTNHIQTIIGWIWDDKERY